MMDFKGYDPDTDETLYKVFVYDKATGNLIDSNILPESEFDGFFKPLLEKHPDAEWGVDIY